MKRHLPKPRLKRNLWTVFSLLVLVLAYGVYYINSLLPIITGYPAKYLCSAVFISGREQAEVEAMDLHFSFIKYTKNVVDFQDSSVTSSFLWKKSMAIYRKGFGSTLLRGVNESDLRKIKFPKLTASYNPDTIAWPMGNIMPVRATSIDTVKLDEITENLMDDDSYNGHAFAFMVIHKGIPVAEAYQPQFNEKTRFLSWSMAKSFTNTLAGIMVKDGKWDINQPMNIEEWKSDNRRTITFNNLMQAESGLLWNEDYGNRSDVTEMLYCEKDFARFVFNQPLEAPVGSKWYYSSGNPNVVTYQLRKSFDNDLEYYQFPTKRLFDKIGMPDAVFEVDPSGTFVGSSYIYATARDYARYGLLHLQDGVFNGERILPEGWVKYITQPNKHSKGQYGSLFWLNKSGEFPSAPKDMFCCKGYDGQRIFMIPSKELVVVILGFSHKPDHVMNCDELLADILSTINQP
jgi:CubicO group peptidase (beta-lactamase class C family)